MKVGAAAPFLSEFRSELKLRTGYSPFLRLVATSALLAAFLLKFSTIIAPVWGVQVTSWLATLLYLYFALARASFVRTHCVARGKAMDAAALARGSMAFNVALASRKRELVAVVALFLLVGAGADSLIRGNSSDGWEAVNNAMMLLGIVAWLGWCPRFLVACGLWAIEGRFSLRRSMALTRGSRRLGSAWLVVVAVIAVVATGALSVLYMPLRTIVVAVVPSARAVFLFSALFYACLIAFQLALQSAFAAWISPLLLRKEAEQARDAGEKPRSGWWRARRRPIDRAEVLLCRVLGSILCLAGVLIAGFTLPNVSGAIEARVVASEPACAVLRRASLGWVGGEAMPCDEADRLIEQNPGRKHKRVEGALLALAFRDQQGVERIETMFLESPRAAPTIAAGAIRIDYVPDAKPAVRPASRAGMRISIFLVFGFLGLGLYYLRRR